MPPRPINIFYSWQSDLPNRVNRGFIGDALQRAADAVRIQPAKAATPVEFCPAVDRDTKGRLGSPGIAETIFAKVSAADVFVGDVSIIHPQSSGKARKMSRRTPNPNVMAELGFAAGKIGWDRVICVFNEGFGTLECLPFDLRGRSVVTYDLGIGGDKVSARNVLVGKLKEKLTPLFETAWFAHRPHPLRFAAYENVALLVNRFFPLLSGIHRYSRSEDSDNTWAAIFDPDSFVQSLAWTSAVFPMTFAGGRTMPLVSYLAAVGEEFKQGAARTLERYSINLEPALYEALHAVENSTFLRSLAHYERIQELDRRDGTSRAPVLASYIVAGRRDLRALRTIVEWCEKERADLAEYDPEILSLEPPVHGEPGIWRVA